MIDFDRMAATAVAEHLAEEERAAGKNRKDVSTARIGVRTILALADGHGGQTWQHRWVAAGADAPLLDALYASIHDDGYSKTRQDRIRRGLRLLIAAGIIRPGLPVLTRPRGAKLALLGLRPEHGPAIERVVAASCADIQISEASALRVRYACAAMIVLTGRPLHQILPSEWATAERHTRDAATAHRTWKKAAAAAAATGGADPERPDHAVAAVDLVSLDHAYTGAVAVGLIAPEPNPEPGRLAVPPTLSRAMAPAETLDHVFDTVGKEIGPRIRALLRDAYTLDGAALDNSTIRRNIGEINGFLRVVHEVLPGHDSLDIPMHAREALLRHLKEGPVSGRKAGTKRKGAAHTLGRIRSQYALADSVVQRYGLTDHLPTLGSFPWPANVLRKLAAQEREHRRTQLTQLVRQHIGHLDGLIAAGTARLDRLDRIAAAAHAADRGATFTVDGVDYRRAKRVDIRHVGAGRELVKVWDPVLRRYFDVDETAHRAARALTLFVLLRETGLRVEEASELTVQSIAPYTSGDFTFPVLHVKPSKQDRARTVGLPVAALRALASLLARNRKMYGRDPLVDRTDRHENTEQAPAHLLFFSFHRRTFVGPTRETLATWLNDVVQEYNRNHNTGVALPPVRPHQLRRLFATDLAERGADPVAVQKTLGHKQLQTTSIYFHLDEADAIAEVTEARRRERAADRGTVCSHCQGHGVLPAPPPTTHEQPETPPGMTR